MKPLEELGISPAPWRENYLVVCDASDWHRIYASANTLADARLIAAAPSLYEALAAMLSCAEKNAPYLDMSHMDIAMDMARKAIKSAGGME